MKRNNFLFITAWLLFCLPSAYAETITGNQFLRLSDEDKGWYFLGALEAIEETRDTFFSDSEPQAADFDRFWETCISDRPIRQHLAIFNSWMQENPIRWNEPVISLIIQSQLEACEQLEVGS